MTPLERENYDHVRQQYKGTKAPFDWTVVVYVAVIIGLMLAAAYFGFDTDCDARCMDARP